MEERYDRQKLIESWDQEKIQSSSVLMLGVGALGSHVAINLALTGVGELHLVDFDDIEISNLNRQLLFTEADLGRKKAEVAKEKLQVLNPQIDIYAYSYDMMKLPGDVFQSVDVIVACLDSFVGRRWANSVSVRYNKPMVTAGIFGFLGDVQTIVPRVTPCFECEPIVAERELQQACSPRGANQEVIELEEEQPVPAVATMSAIIGGLQSQEVIKLLLGLGAPVKNFLTINGLTNTFLEVPLARKTEQCLMCGEVYATQKQEVNAFRGELVGNFRIRIAYSLGMSDPIITHGLRLLTDEEPLDLDDGSELLITESGLAKPVTLVLKYKDQSGN